jgi:hypothetical protein
VALVAAQAVRLTAALVDPARGAAAAAVVVLEQSVALAAGAATVS